MDAREPLRFTWETIVRKTDTRLGKGKDVVV